MPDILSVATTVGRLPKHPILDATNRDIAATFAPGPRYIRETTSVSSPTTPRVSSYSSELLAQNEIKQLVELVSNQDPRINVTVTSLSKGKRREIEIGVINSRIADLARSTMNMFTSINSELINNNYGYSCYYKRKLGPIFHSLRFSNNSRYFDAP